MIVAVVELCFVAIRENWQQILFYGRQSAFRSHFSENLTLANSLTVLQTYRQAFSFPQWTLNWLIYTGFFSLKLNAGIFALNLNTGFFDLKLWATLDNLRVKNPVFKLRVKIPAFKSINFKSYLTWPGFELKTVWKKTPLHALTNWAIGTDMKRDIIPSLWA